jgi:hypothetical protein
MFKALPSLIIALIFLPTLSGAAPFQIKIIDSENGWPVPLVKLTTTGNLTFITDNAGLVAIDAPELINRDVWFTSSSDGYTIKDDSFGNRGFRATIAPDQIKTFAIERTAIAKRLGRITGAGIFAESQKLGLKLDWKESGVTGCDTIQSALHRGQKIWIWGDTNLHHYPLGIFHLTGGTTTPRPLKSFKPPLELPITYFRSSGGKNRPLAKFPGEGPTWIGGLISLPDKNNTPRLVATYVKVRNFLKVYQQGLCLWNEDTKNFEPLKVLWNHHFQTPNPPLAPEGHPFINRDSNGKTWAYFGDPFPSLRIPATFEAWQNPATWEPLTPQPHLTSTKGKKVLPHRGSIAWNSYRKKWITIFTQKGGSPSPLGEIWYAEANQPTGPWGPATKILSHQSYSFYNPYIHADLTPVDSPILIFEGTYTQLFSQSPIKTPRYDYNQILYRLDLDDPALNKYHPTR